MTVTLNLFTLAYTIVLILGGMLVVASPGQEQKSPSARPRRLTEQFSTETLTTSAGAVAGVAALGGATFAIYKWKTTGSCHPLSQPSTPPERGDTQFMELYLPGITFSQDYTEQVSL